VATGGVMTNAGLKPVRFFVVIDATSARGDADILPL